MSSAAPQAPFPAPLRPGARVLVTGAAGFVGAALVRELLARGIGVLGVDDLSAGRVERLPEDPGLELVVADVTRPGVLSGLALRGVGAVVHLAARVGVRAVLEDPEGCQRENVAGARALAQALAPMGAARRPRVLFASSSEVYRPRRGPLRESDPLRPLGGLGRWRYAASKRAGEELLDAHLRGGPGALHLRLFNVVGPDQDAGTGMVLPTFVERAREGEPLPVHGDGSAVRCFAHVDEVARVLADLLALEHPPAGPLNVGGRARSSVLELAHLVAELAGKGAPVERVDPLRAVSPRFEGVAWREPCLERLERLGLRPPAMTLPRIVADVLARRPCEPRAGAGASPHRGDGCASPGS